MNLILNFNSTLEKIVITFQVAEYGSPLKKSIDSLERSIKWLLFRISSVAFCYTDTVYQIINKDDLVEKKVNTNIDRQPFSYLKCLRHLLFIVKISFKHNPIPTGLGQPNWPLLGLPLFLLDRVAKYRAEIVSTILIKIGCNYLCLYPFSESPDYLGTKVKLD